MIEGEVTPPRVETTAPEPLDRAFERVPLPADALEIVAIDGRDERDVWLLGAGGWKVALFRWDGAQIVKEESPRCKMQIEYTGLLLVPDGLITRARSFESEGGVPVEVRRPNRGKWACEHRTDQYLTRVGAELLRFDWSSSLTISGRKVPMPELGSYGASQVEVHGRSPADLWMYFPENGDVLHGNGVTWESRPPGVAAVKSLRVDATGAAWLVGTNENKYGEGNVVMRWDAAARAWKRLPAPADLRAARIRVSGDRDAWLLGKEHVHHWDGTTFRRGKTPVERLQGAWVSAGGELWIVGGNASNTPSGRNVVGAAFRVPAVKRP